MRISRCRQIDPASPRVHGTYRTVCMTDNVGPMQEVQPRLVARMSAEASASADLDDVCRWLIQRQFDPVLLDIDDVPALGQGSRLKLALPITAPRAVLCALWLLEDADEGGCLLVGQLRFVAHPTGPDIRLSFRGRTATATMTDRLHGQADHAARQLLDVIAKFIDRALSPSPSLAFG